MNYIETSIQGVFIIEPCVFTDERGYFFETFREDEMIEKTGVHFVQENESFSQYGVLRGLHFQHEPYAQAKLVRVVRGTVLDVALDMRAGSPTFGKHVAVELSDENKRQFFVPAGFAHGFIVLSKEGANFSYKCSNYYNKESEGGVRFDDPALGIGWKMPKDEISVAQKDRDWKSLEEAL
ncbi:MAG: dTDP-4-dehydrorhamnose 3,5-epimerase [Candidatus Uhrbacteria bacterium]|nr:dTDP-4-dehydrorhamnose 3,5-epimerase [Candidatus Uhrbacteria bacterium]